MQYNFFSKLSFLMILFFNNNLAYAVIDTIKPQLKLSVYWGEDPEVAANSTIVSTNSQDLNKSQTLYVEDGETVSLVENSIIKLTKAAGGGQLQSQKKEYRDVDSAVIADVAKNITKTNNEIAELTQEIKNAKYPLLQRLNDRLSNATKKLAMLQAKQDSLEKSSADIQKQSNYDETNGIEVYEFVDLPAGIYLKPKMLNDHQVRVEINIIKTDAAAKKAFSANVKALTKQIKSTFRVTVNQWQKISGQDDISSTRKQVTIYSTTINTQSNNVWLKVELVD